MDDITIMVGNVKFNYRVGLIIKDEENVLVETNPNSNNVFVPGGRVKTLEDTKESLIREMTEEMGINFKEEDLGLISVFENFFTHNNIKIHELFFAYKLNNLDKYNINVTKNLDSDSNYYKWVNINDLNRVNLLPTKLIDVIKNNEFKHVVSKDE